MCGADEARRQSDLARNIFILRHACSIVPVEWSFSVLGADLQAARRDAEDDDGYNASKSIFGTESSDWTAKNGPCMNK